MNMRRSARQIAEWVAGLLLLAGMVILYNGWAWLWEGNPTIPELDGRWWAGYYDTSAGRLWSVARFVPDGSGGKQMVLLSPFGDLDRFIVHTSSEDRSFVQLVLTDDAAAPPLRIEASQRYLGERYIIGRLLSGRLSDFWEANDDERILGQIVSWTPPAAFELEPISDDDLKDFWSRYVRPGQPVPSAPDLLRAAGIALASPPGATR